MGQCGGSFICVQPWECITGQYRGSFNQVSIPYLECVWCENVEGVCIQPVMPFPDVFDWDSVDETSPCVNSV